MKYLTTAIDYVNSLPHIGTAYEKIGADVIVRWQKFLGNSVLFQMGNDEHSANVQKASEKQGLAPSDYCNQMRPKFEEIWQKLAISYDQFIQTSEQRHHSAVNKFFSLVQKSGDIEQKNYEGPYCESCEAFFTEKDLVDGLCPHHKTKPQWLKEKNYFFNLPKYGEKILQKIESEEFLILPLSRRNEVINFIKNGLEPISISRSSFTWGIPLPIDSKHVFYVWFDALINYLTGLGFGSADESQMQIWPETVHIVGKDITRFHCIIWPAMLLSAGLPLPKMVFGHGFVYLRGEKMSKSLGNVVTPLDVLSRYPDFGADALRYVLLRGSSFGEDGNFTWESFIERYNADLANGLGNLASRILGMVWKYQGGELKAEQPEMQDDMVSRSAGLLEKIKTFMNPVESKDIATHLALAEIFSEITKIDQYIDTQAPWKLFKEKNTEKLSFVLTNLVESVRKMSLLISPFLPLAAARIWAAYGFTGDVLEMNHTALQSHTVLKQGHKLRAEKLQLFPRIEVVAS